MNYRQALCGGLTDPVGRVAELKASGWKARTDVSPWKLKRPVNWSADPYRDRNWVFQLNAWRPLDILICAHDRLKDDSLLDDAVDLMLDWGRYEKTHRNDEVLWNDMASGLRAAKLAYALSQTRMHAPDMAQRLDDLTKLARKHLKAFRNPDFIGPSNHGLFQVHGTLALCKALPDDPAAKDGRAYVESMFSALLRDQFGDEGVHLEHSPGYHLFALKTVKRIAATGWYADMPQVSEAIELADKRTAWFVHPNGTLSEIGDSSAVQVPLPKSTADNVVGRLFKEAGYAVVRHWRGAQPEQASMLLVTGGHHSNVHKHADCLSFELYEQGRVVFVDTGKYSYSRKEWREFTDSAAAHNTVNMMEERKNNGVRNCAPVGGMLSAMYKVGETWIVEGGYRRPEFGTAHARTFVYSPGRWLILLDHLKSTTRRRMTAWLHLAPEIEASADDGGWRFPGGDIRYISTTQAELAKHRGETTPEIRGWKATAYHGRVPSDALGFSVTGEDERIATIIRFGDAALPNVTVSAEGFRVSDNEGTVLIDHNRVVDTESSHISWI